MRNGSGEVRRESAYRSAKYALYISRLHYTTKAVNFMEYVPTPKNQIHVENTAVGVASHVNFKVFVIRVSTCCLHMVIGLLAAGFGFPSLRRTSVTGSHCASDALLTEFLSYINKYYHKLYVLFWLLYIIFHGTAVCQWEIVFGEISIRIAIFINSNNLFQMT